MTDVASRPGLLGRLWRSWALRSLAVGAVATAADYGLVTALTYAAGLPAPAATSLGLALGATLNFFGNRLFAFQATDEPAGPQALRFAVGIGSIIGVHAVAIWGLTGSLALPVLLAKPVADVTILLGGQLFVLRRFVFRPPAAPADGGD